MDHSHTNNLKITQKSVRMVWELGDLHLISLDPSIVKKLKIRAGVWLEQEIVENGILMKVKSEYCDGVNQ